jgi:hypothetical protein
MLNLLKIQILNAEISLVCCIHLRVSCDTIAFHIQMKTMKILVNREGKKGKNGKAIPVTDRGDQ